MAASLQQLLAETARPLEIRPMRVRNLPRVLAIEEAVYPTSFSASGYRNELENNPLSHYHILLEDGQPLLGYVGYWMLAGECHISTIAVDPDEQGNGYGELLLLYALLASLDQAAFLATLEVRETNELAQTLYSKTGFEHVGRRKNYYKDTGESAEIMTLDPLARAALLDQWTALELRLSSNDPVE